MNESVRNVNDDGKSFFRCLFQVSRRRKNGKNDLEQIFWQIIVARLSIINSKSAVLRKLTDHNYNELNRNLLNLST